MTKIPHDSKVVFEVNINKGTRGGGQKGATQGFDSKEANLNDNTPQGITKEKQKLQQESDDEDQVYQLQSKEQFNQIIQEEQHDNDSIKSDQIDEATMNVFGFNDDLNLDDRVIIQNPTEN